MMFKMFPEKDSFLRYRDRLQARDAYKRATEIDEKLIDEMGLARPSRSRSRSRHSPSPSPHRKRAGESLSRPFFCRSARAYRRLPMKRSRNRNMLMKSR